MIRKVKIFILRTVLKISMLMSLHKVPVIKDVMFKINNELTKEDIKEVIKIFKEIKDILQKMWRGGETMITILTIISYLILIIYVVYHDFKIYILESKNLKKFTVYVTIKIIITICELVLNLFRSIVIDNIIFFEMKELFLKYFFDFDYFTIL